MRSPKIFHRRNLPHIQPQGATFFVTYLLHGAMPAPLKEKLLAERESRITKAGRSIVKEDIDKENRRYFKKLDDWLDRIPHAVYWLRDERLAQIVSDNWHYWDRKRIELIAFCIMPNHVHVVFRPFEQDEAGKELFCSISWRLSKNIRPVNATLCLIEQDSLSGSTSPMTGW